MGGCGVSILGDFHIGQNPDFNPIIASTDVIDELALNLESRSWCPFQVELSYKTVAC